MTTPENQQPETVEAEIQPQDAAAVTEDLSAAEEAQAVLLHDLVEAIDIGDESRCRGLVKPTRSADLADLIGLMDSHHRIALIDILKSDLDPEVLSELEGAALEQVIGVLELGEIAVALTKLETDDAIEVLEEMDLREQREVLEQLPGEERLAIVEGLSYPEDSAGRMMQRDLIAVPPFWTFGQTLEYLQEDEDLPTDFWEIFIVDPQHKPIGTMPLSWVMRANSDQIMSEIMLTEQTLIPVALDQEEVAHLFRQYNLVSAAVVDKSERLVGMITVDDIVDVIDEEAGEDILALAGVSEGDVNISVRSISRTRFGWLLLNLLTAILASVVIAMFGASIEKLVALAILMPIVASMGGNAATQTMTVAVRALAARELTSVNTFRVLGKEVVVGLMNGSVLAIIMGGIAALWFSNPALGVIVAAAMIINMLVASLSGILVPVVLERFDIDPAVASTVFVTTITDVVGFLAFLGLAALFLL